MLRVGLILSNRKRTRITSFYINSLGSILSVRKLATIECCRGSGKFKRFQYVYYVEILKRDRTKLYPFYSVIGEGSDYNKLVTHLKTLGKVFHSTNKLERFKNGTLLKKATEHLWSISK